MNINKNNKFSFNELFDMFGFNKNNLIFGVALRQDDILKNTDVLNEALNTFTYFHPAVFNRHSKIIPGTFYNLDSKTGKYNYDLKNFKFLQSGIDAHNNYINFLNKNNSKGGLKCPQSAQGLRRDYVSCHTDNKEL